LLEPNCRIGRRDAPDPGDRHGIADGELIVGVGDERAEFRPLRAKTGDGMPQRAIVSSRSPSSALRTIGAE
jgi:hypothetical protein